MSRSNREHSATKGLEPTPRYEQIKGARYWPDTLFVDISAYPDNFQYLELDEVRLLKEGDLDIFVATGARMHEQLHWLQSVGSTFGRFLALNRITTGDLADAILATATPRELDRLIEARARGMTPAHLRPDGLLRHDFDYSPTVQSLFDHWWSSIRLEQFLVADRRGQLGPVDPRFMVGLSLRYIAAGDDLRAVFNDADSHFMERTRAFGPIDESLAPILHSGLTMRHIEEGAALVVQHLYNRGLAAVFPEDRYIEYAARSLAWTLDRFIDDRHSLYAKALQYFSPRAPAVKNTRQLELFLLVCDIALNPAIPDDGATLGTSWADFHPVRRFECLVAALDGFSADDHAEGGAPAANWWVEERARLVARAGISDGAGTAKFGAQNWPEVDEFESPASFLRGFINRAGANLAKVRQEFPAVCASPVHAADPGADSFFAAVDALNGPCFDSPLIIRSGGSGSPSTITDRLYGQALTAVTILRAMHSWLVSRGQLNFRGLPTDPRGEVARTLAFERLGRRGIAPVLQ